MVVQTPPEPSAPDPPQQHRILDSPEQADAGVIDDARARQLRQRMAGLTLAAIAVAAGLVLGFSGGRGGSDAGGHHRSGGSPGGAGNGGSRPVAVIAGPGISANEFGLMAPNIGWGALGTGFYMTRDGGRRWLGLSIGTDHGNQYGNAAVPGFGLTGDITANITATASPSARVLAIGFIDGRAAPSCKPPRYPATGPARFS